jgi:hypothetical protein
MDLDPRFTKMVAALARDRAYAAIVDEWTASQAAAATGKPKKFGAGALKVGGKIFAMSGARW